MTAASQKNRRFPSIDYDQSRTRASLRDRLERFLPTAKVQVRRPSSEITLSDEAFLRLLVTVRIKRSGTIESAEATYQGAVNPGAPFPSLAELIDAGWIRTARGRVFITVDAARAAQKGLVENIVAYKAVQESQYGETYSFDLPADPELDDTKRALEAKEITLHAVGSQRSEWVVARLWEVFSSSFDDDQKALEAWLDLWHDIGYPRLVPMDSWVTSIAERFHHAALKLLECEPLTKWDAIIDRLSREASNIWDVEVSTARSHFLPVPETVLGRYLWLTSNRHERAFQSAMWPMQQLSGLVSLLMADVERNDLLRPPHPLFDKVMSILEERPELMFFFILSLRNHPLLLADMLFRPSTSAWACLLIWRSQLNRDAWGVQAHRQEDERNKAAIFADAISVLRFLFDEKKIPPEEVAELLAEVFQYERATPDTSIEDTNAMRLQLLDELAQSNTERTLKLLENLFRSPEMTGPGTGAFDGALALVESAHLAAVVDPVPLLQAYVAAMARDEYDLSAHQITALQANALFELALRAGGDIQESFFNPLRVAERLSARLEPDANPYKIADAISRTIRVHTRILSRAVVAQSDVVPDKLVDALVKTVETGALNRAERNQVDAFAASYETDFPTKTKDRSISADLGDALSRLTGSQRDRLLQAVLQIEEPLALVRLLFFTPAELRDTIEQRIRTLTPDKATELYMYTAAQMRIDQLLDADFPDVAEAFLESEFKATTSWSIPGRAVHRLRQQLRLHFLRREWEQIQQCRVPEGIPEQERQAAQDTIEFFRGLASLTMDDGLPQDAETRFANLQRSHPDVAAYTVNLHAARVALLLGPNMFGYLDRDKYSDAFRVISEGKEALSRFRDLSPDDEAILRLNIAVLFLAVKQPVQVLEVLDGIPASARSRDTAFGYRAVALARNGELSLAAGVLEAGESQFGTSVALDAARKHIQSQAPYAGRVSTTADQDVVSTIKKALHDLMLLDPGEQARALTAGNGNVGDFLLIQFREAAAATVDLAPMLRALNADSIEDDITAIFKEILHARLRHVHWSAQDQGKGGFTDAGNPGERDLTIRKDTAILSVGEAVMTRHKTSNKFTRGELKSHLEKLFAYATCPAYFHVTYEMSGDEAGVIEHLRKVSREVLIDGIAFIRHEEMDFVDSAPRGFTAVYRSSAGIQTVHFLVLDFHQGIQKAAAKASSASNPRT